MISKMTEKYLEELRKNIIKEEDEIISINLSGEVRKGMADFTVDIFKDLEKNSIHIEND